MKEKIKNYILSELLDNKSDMILATNDDILSNGMIDSIEVIQLITFIEDSFEIKIPPEDMIIENFITVDAIENYIINRK